MNIKHVFFDLDHTLWDFEKNSELAFQQIFKEQDIQIDVAKFLRVYSPINFKYWKLYREEQVDKSTLRYYRLKDTFDALSYTISNELIDKIAVDYITYLPNYNHLIAGSIELLDYLRDKYELHIITNGFEEVQTLKMERSGIIDYFQMVITSESVGVKKPNPRVFEYALKKANAVSEESIMIGDNLEADIIGALDCNIKAIYCNFDSEKVVENIVSVSHLLEIKQYI